MEANSSTLLFLLFCTVTSTSILPSFSSLLDDISQEPPLDFNTTITSNCRKNPSLRYCNLFPFSSSDISDIYQSMVVSNHLCNDSLNSNCIEIFSDINLQSRPDLAPLYLSFSSFWKFCPLTINTISLSHNNLKGSFPGRILQCQQITALDLSHNNLIGYLPIDNLSRLTNLTTLDLSYNYFSGDVPTTGFFRRFNYSSFIHSGLSSGSGGFSSGLTIVLVVFLIIAFLVLAVLECLFLTRPDFLPAIFRRRSPHRFTPAMIKAATKQFADENVVGKSGRYEIYRGVLRDGREVAAEVRKEKLSREERKAFVEECNTLVQVRHNNIIQVLGWCDRRGFRAVVKEWVGNCSVEEWLTQGNNDGPSWNQRLKVAMGVANALCYLEDQWPTVGFDMRLGSMIMTASQEPCIYRLKVEDQISPSKRTYKLGLFVMELITNRRGKENFEQGESEFVEWMRLHFPGHTRRVMDERMKKTIATCEQVRQVIGIALMCTDHVQERRPSIGQASGMIAQVYRSPPSWAIERKPDEGRGREIRSSSQAR